MIPRIRFPDLFGFGNRISRISFSVSGVDVAAGSQGTNLDAEKVDIAWREALALWTAVTPLEFQPALAGEEPRLHLFFVHDNQQSTELGATSGFISRTPTGLTGSASITIDCDNKLAVDRFLEPERLPTMPGPFDLVAVTAHEVGHALGLDHPPLDPATGKETEPAMMSRSFGNNLVRHLFPFDVREVQRLHGALQIAATISSPLSETGQIIDPSSPEILLQRGSFGLVLSGPMETRTFLDVLVPAKGHLINSLRLKFTTVTPNVFVNRATVFDGIVPVQTFAISARASAQDGLAGKPQDLRFGFLRRPETRNDMIVRLEVFFTKKDGIPQSDFGVVQVEQIAVETILLSPVLTSVTAPTSAPP